MTQTQNPVLRIEPIRSRRIAIKVLLSFCAHRLNVGEADILSPTRIKQATLARHLVGYIAAAYFGMTLYQIGDFLGRNYTSVMSGRNRIAAVLKQEGATYDRVREIVGEFLDLYYPAFAIPNICKQDLEGKGKGSVFKRGIQSMESRSGGRVVKTKIEAALALDQGPLSPAHHGAETQRQEAARSG
jgi:hypothetical protein